MTDEDRFLNVGEGDRTEFINSMKNANTVRKTKCDIGLFQTWLLATQNEERLFSTIENEKLDQYLARFFISVRNKKGEEYEPDTLKSIQSSINRHLNENSETDVNILTDKNFQHSRDVLSAKKKDLKSKGLGNRKRKADAFTQEAIDHLYDRNLLGTSNPDALINTVWLNNSMHFGMRSRQEHQDMKFGDIEMKATSGGVQYLEFTERQTKTRKGEGSARPFAPKMFAIADNPRCPVKTFKTYIQSRPTGSLKPGSKFYLSILPRYHNKGHDDFDTENTNTWYSMRPMGKNKLGDLVKVMSEKGGLTGRKVNHSARKTTVTSLLHSHVEATTVMQLTGHKNVASTNDYSSASLDQQIKMSNILSDIGSGGKSVCTEPAVMEKQAVNMIKSSDIDFPNEDNLILADMDLQAIDNYESSTTCSKNDHNDKTFIVCDRVKLNNF
ncbi:uncharacterized protein KIAA1958-like [Mytilus galloprovincialis]|uniref:uncharacterized protein KIAA1958-like n=1 Tax=Mytilus galloprovincialis TaxID=29158 RepID=UPI003F7CC35E